MFLRFGKLSYISFNNSTDAVTPATIAASAVVAVSDVNSAVVLFNYYWNDWEFVFNLHFPYQRERKEGKQFL